MSMSTDALILRGVISTLTREEQDKIYAVADTLRKITQDNGDIGKIAIGLLALELANEE